MKRSEIRDREKLKYYYHFERTIYSKAPDSAQAASGLRLKGVKICFGFNFLRYLFSTEALTRPAVKLRTSPA